MSAPDYADMSPEEAGGHRVSMLKYAKSRQEDHRQEARDFVRDALNPDSPLHEKLYKIQTFEPFDDLAACLPAFRRSGDYDREVSNRRLRLLSRYAFRGYAFGAAWQIGEILKDQGDPFGWRLVRGINFGLPRVLMAVILGYVAVSGSGGIIDTLWAISRTSSYWQSLTVSSGLLLALAVNCLGVLRRVGRRPLLIVKRTAYVTAWGVFYTLLGIGLHFCIARGLGLGVTPAFSVLCGSMALGVASVLQLFWEEHSLAEPL